MSTTTRALQVLVVGIVVTSGFAATGVALTEQRYDPGTDGRHGVVSVEPTGDAPAGSSPSGPDLSSVPAVTSIVLLAGHDRPGGSDPLEHDVRKELHEAIHRASGIYVSDLRGSFDVHRSTLRYHLGILEREGLISSESIFGKLWYHPPGSDANELRAALANDATGEIVEAIARLEPVGVTTLAGEVGRSPSTISYHLERLEDEGVVEQERRSTTVVSQLTPDVRAELGTSTILAEAGRE